MWSVKVKIKRNDSLGNEKKYIYRSLILQSSIPFLQQPKRKAEEYSVVLWMIIK